MDGSLPAPPCTKIRYLLAASQPPPLPVRAIRAVRARGVGYAVRRAAQVARLAPPPRPPQPRPKRTWPERADESLDLRPGEVVRVRSAEEIRATLDDAGMYKGLYFMGEMWKYCGREFVVLKRVERILVEATGELKSGLRNTVLLEGACCDGSSNEGCDANCYHFWREVWLRRVTGPEG